MNVGVGPRRTAVLRTAHLNGLLPRYIDALLAAVIAGGIVAPPATISGQQWLIDVHRDNWTLARRRQRERLAAA